MGRVYSQLKPLLFGDRLESYRLAKPMLPVHVRIKPYNRCNHDCWYCAYRKEGLQLGDEMNEADTLPRGKFLELAADLADMGVQAVTFSGGGEPTLHRDLPEVISYLGGRGLKIGCLTNGSTLHRRVGDCLAEYATWARVSVDAWDDASYRKSRGLPDGSFSKLLRAMADFSGRSKKCRLGVSFIITEDSAAHIAVACRQFKDAGVRDVKLSAVVTDNSSSENNQYHQGIRDMVAAQIELAQRLQDEKFTVLNHYHEMSARFDKEYRRCAMANFLTVVGADQNVYLCQDKAYTSDGRLGNISNCSFRETWMSSAVQEKLLSFDPSTQCKHSCTSHPKNLLLNEAAELDQEHAAFV